MTFRNNNAAFLWGFAATFLTFVAAMTCVLMRDGAPQIDPPWNNAHYPLWFVSGLMALFWVAGCGLAAHAACQHCLRVEILPTDEVSVTWRYPFRADSRRIPFSGFAPAEVFETRDDEGSPYFHSRVTLADGVTLDIAEGHSRERCEAACADFNAAAGKIPSSGE